MTVQSQDGSANASSAAVENEDQTQSQADQSQETEASSSTDEQGDETTGDDSEQSDDGSDADDNGSGADDGDSSSGEDQGDGADSEEQRRIAAREGWEERERKRQEKLAADKGLQQGTQEWINAAPDDAERRVRALEAKAFLDGVRTNQSLIANDISRISQEVDIYREFNEDGSKNPAFVPEAFEEALEELAPYLETETVKDSTGKPVTVILGAKTSVHQFLQRKAERQRKLIGSGARAGQQHEQRNRITAEPDSSNGARGSGADSRSDDDLSPDEYAQKHGLKHVRD